MFNGLKQILRDLRTWLVFFILSNKHKNNQVKAIKNIHKGETIFCIGAGPSLDQTDFSKLENQIVILTNSAINLASKIKAKKKYSMIQDTSRLYELMKVDKTQIDLNIRSVHDFSKISLISLIFKSKLVIEKQDIFVMPKLRVEWRAIPIINSIMSEPFGFSNELTDHISFSGSSVIFSAIQTANYLGADKIVLLGADFNYGTKADSYFKGSIPLRHFHQLNYERDIKPTLEFYNQIFNKTKKNMLFNGTPGTQDDVLPKLDFSQPSK